MRQREISQVALDHTEQKLLAAFGRGRPTDLWLSGRGRRRQPSPRSAACQDQAVSGSPGPCRQQARARGDLQDVRDLRGSVPRSRGPSEGRRPVGPVSGRELSSRPALRPGRARSRPVGRKQGFCASRRHRGGAPGQPPLPRLASRPRSLRLDLQPEEAQNDPVNS